MKTKIFFLTLLLLILTGQMIFAGDVSVDKAKIVAKNLYFERVNEFFEVNYEDIIITEVFNFPSDNNKLCYIFNIINDGGYVVISADDHAYPVLAYSLKGNYNKTLFPPAFFELMDSYADQLIEIRQKNLPSSSEIDDAWASYSNGQFSKGLVTTVGPLLKTTWDQSPYYNDSCPNKCVTGCVATMMAQVMKYYAHPAKGQGTHSYTSNYGVLTVNFGAATYNYAAMPNNVNSPNAEVAKLLYHCGVSVDMNYTPYGSGASMSDASYALQAYFKYSNTTVAQYKMAYTTIYWEILIRAELINKRPIPYAGGSHAFVCDGFQYPNHFHFNFGWGGMGDGYFYVTNINPAGNYTSNQIAITDCYPNPYLTSEFPTSESPDFIGSDLYYLGMDKAASEHTANLYPNPNNGKFVLTVINSQNDPMNIYITDISGKIVRVMTINKTSPIYYEEIDVTDLPVGFYVLAAEGQKQKVIQKFIIK